MLDTVIPLLSETAVDHLVAGLSDELSRAVGEPFEFCLIVWTEEGARRTCLSSGQRADVATQLRLAINSIPGH